MARKTHSVAPGSTTPAGDNVDGPMAGVPGPTLASPLLSLPGLEAAGIAGFTADRDSYLSQALPEGVDTSGVLPESEESFYARDPFSADYADFLKSRSAARRSGRKARVDEGLRASLLERPYLMEKPEAAVHRGAAAVWRSLKDQLKQESQKIIDDSDAAELQTLESELASRRALVMAVGKGIDMLLKRLRQRLNEGPAPAVTPAATVPAADAVVSESAPGAAPPPPSAPPPSAPPPSAPPPKSAASVSAASVAAKSPKPKKQKA